MKALFFLKAFQVISLFVQCIVFGGLLSVTAKSSDDSIAVLCTTIVGFCVVSQFVLVAKTLNTEK